MKTISIYVLVLFVALMLSNCSTDTEIIEPVIENPKPQDDNNLAIPMESLANIGAVAIAGFPKEIKKFSNGSLYYWAQYYFRPDEKLLKVRYGYPSFESTIYADTYHYDNNGQLIKLIGHDDYDFYWNLGRIVEAHRYNGMWHGHSKIFYEYNTEGQTIQKLEINTDFNFQDKVHYSYYEDGNLKSIEEYSDYNQNGEFIRYKMTTFESYNNAVNLFPEVQIIPGQALQQYFPLAMEFKHFTAAGYGNYETYQYTFNAHGRVVEKRFGTNTTLYEYY